MIRLAILGLFHEANSYSAHRVDNAYFQASEVLYGDDIVARYGNGTRTVSGYLAACAKHDDVEVVPLVLSILTPAGVITAEALQIRTDELVMALEENGPFDGVLASLHGAAVAEDYLDVDGYLLRLFREVVGPRVPIGASLDLHANISAEMCRHSDVLNTCRTNPHLDAREVAEEVADLVIRTVRGEIRPTQAFEALPAAINILCQNTDESPMREIMEEVRATMTQPGVLSATVGEGYPYADVPEMGVGVIVVSDNDPQAAARRARALAEKVWSRRDQFDARAPSALEALRLAEKAPQVPVLLLDVGDNIGGGSPGDSVVLLNAAREIGFEDVLIIIHDPAAAALCDEVGVEGRVELSIGAKTDPETGPPVDATATVLALHDGVYETNEALHNGLRYLDAGRSAAVRLDSGQTVILTSKVELPVSTVHMTTLGLKPSQFRAIVAKGVHSPLAGYLPHVAEMIRVDTPGVTSANLRRFNYAHRRRPMFPFEPSATYPPAGKSSRRRG